MMVFVVSVLFVVLFYVVCCVVFALFAGQLCVVCETFLRCLLHSLFVVFESVCAL